MTSKYIDDIIKKLHIQIVGDGEGYIDLICPINNIDNFIDEMNNLKSVL